MLEVAINFNFMKHLQSIKNLLNVFFQSFSKSFMLKVLQK